MVRSRRVRLALFMAFCCSSFVFAQEPPAFPSSPIVTAAMADGKVRFSAPSDMCQIRVEVFSGSDLIFDSAWQDGSVFDWQAAPDSGAYRCLVMLKDVDGRIAQRQATLNAEDGRLTGGDGLTIIGDNGPKVTLLAHDGTNGAVVTTSGDLTFRFGNFLAGKETVKMRLSAEGDLSVDGMIQANRGIMFPDGTILTTAGGAATIAGGGLPQHPGSAQPAGGGTTQRPMVRSPILPLAPRTPKPTSGAPAAQFVVGDTGVSVGTTNPAYALTVTGDVSTGTRYDVGGSPILSSPSANSTVIGVGAGHSTAGTSNTFVGASAGGFNNAVNGENVAVGDLAGERISSGSGNTLIGSTAGVTITTEMHDTVVGWFAGVNTGVSNATALGAGANATQSNTVILGGNSVSTGIRTTAPNQSLGVGGGMTIDENNNNNGSVLADSVIAFGTAASNGVSGEAIASQRTASGGNQYGLDFYTLYTKRMSISNSGLVSINNLGSAGATQLCLNASNQVATCSSSIRYKDDIADFQGGLDVVRQLRPVTFRWKDSGKPDVGLVAEEVDAVEPLLATQANGHVEGVKYDHLTVVLINAVKELEQENKALRARIEKLERAQTTR